MTRKNKTHTGYYGRPELQKCEMLKSGERQKVIDHLLGYHDRNAEQLRFFGLPGVGWTCERLISESRPEAQFVAVERERKIAQRVAANMPNGPGCVDGMCYALRRPKQVCPYASDLGVTPWAFKTENARLLNTTASKFLALGPDDFLGDGDKWEKWQKIFHGFTCGWLDTTSPCNIDYLRSIKLFAERASDYEVPFAATFQYGRDEPWDMKYMEELTGGTLEFLPMRTEAIRLSASTEDRPAKILSSWYYWSHNDGRMATVLGVLPRKAGA